MKEPWKRLICLFIYMIPWSNALYYGNNIFTSFPILKLFIIPTLPILIIKQSLPLGNFLILILLLIGIVKNQQISYFIRLNTMQAILLNIILIIFNYLKIILLTISINYVIVETIETSIFILNLSIVIFSSVQCFRGMEADIPVISNSAKMQI